MPLFDTDVNLPGNLQMARNPTINRKRSTQEKRRKIMKAAVTVFARKGFARCRISDIAAEAEVAYGLVYHYFENKEEILNSIFDENWGLLSKVIDTTVEQSESLEERLLAIVSFICDAYRLAPEIIQVMVIEIARSSKFLKKSQIEVYERVFNRLTEILEDHQKTGEIQPGLDPKFMAYCFFGALELVLTGYLLNTLTPGADDFEAFKSSLVKMFLDGIRRKG
ncbi:MAG TPA: TetR/AcrR family transcriptional regulator [Myxococcota bacterium]|nr:TetR/AcrR family transcriptional regulator [Myxococcota bacterium]